MQVKIKKLHPDAKIPTYATEGSACFDLYAAECIDHGEYAKGWEDHFDTGLSFEIPEGNVMLVMSRSGNAFKYDSTLVNSVGVIDSDYRGAVRIKLSGAIPAGVGDRIAQAMIIPVEQVTFIEADNLSETKRGTSGFGSTGVK